MRDLLHSEHVERIEIRRNPFVGLFLKASDSAVLAPFDLKERVYAAARRVFCVDVVKTTIAGSRLIGTLVAMNSSGAALPESVHRDEVARLKALGLNVALLPEKCGACGNNILVNDRAAVVSANIPKAHEEALSDAFGVEVVKSKAATPSANNIVTNSFLLTSSTEEKEIKPLEEVFHFKARRVMANKGAAAISTCVVANSMGALVGEATSTEEMKAIEEAFVQSAKHPVEK